MKNNTKTTKKTVKKQYELKKLPRPLGGIDMLMLKTIGTLFMLLYFLALALPTLGNWTFMLGQLAFPIFAFILVEGFFCTENQKKYGLKLLLLALISEIPYNLFMSGSIFNLYRQSAVWTLFIGFLVICVMEIAKKKGAMPFLFTSLFAITLGFFLSTITFMEYYGFGVMMVVLFYVFRGQPIIQTISLILVNYLLGVIFYEMGYSPKLQMLSVLAMVPIWLYNGDKGYENKKIQYGFYAVLPIMLLVLYAISI